MYFLVERDFRPQLLFLQRLNQNSAGEYGRAAEMVDSGRILSQILENVESYCLFTRYARGSVAMFF